MLSRAKLSMVTHVMLMLLNSEITKQLTFYGIRTLSVMKFAEYVKNKFEVPCS